MSWVGALMTVCASYVCGAMLAKGESERLEAVDSLLKLLSYMRRRISAERMPLYRIFAEFEDGFLERCGFLEVMRSHRQGPESLWLDAIKTLPTGKELQDELSHFGISLGALSLEEQLKRLDALYLFLSESRESLKGVLAQRQKSIKTVCLLMGLTAAIILL